MLNDLNKTHQIGRLGADAKQASDNSNAPVTFSIATTEKWKEEGSSEWQERVDWHNIVVFGNLRKYAKKFKKGDRVYVEGKLRNNNYEKTVGKEKVMMYGAEIHAAEIELLKAKDEE